MKIALLFGRRLSHLLVTEALQQAGMQAAAFTDVQALLGALRREDFDAVVLEDDEEQTSLWLCMLQMQGAAGLPRIVAGGLGGAGVASALQHGASDYANMQSGAAELVSRLRAHVLLRRNAGGQRRLCTAGFVLDAKTQVLAGEGVEVCLTGREFALAWTLFANAGCVVSLPALSAQVWGRSVDVCKRTIEQHVYKLRRKLASEGIRGVRIQAAYAVGYRLDLDEAPATAGRPDAVDHVPGPGSGRAQRRSPALPGRRAMETSSHVSHQKITVQLES